MLINWKARKVNLYDRGPAKGKIHQKCGTQLRMGDSRDKKNQIRYAWCQQCGIILAPLNMLDK